MLSPTVVAPVSSMDAPDRPLPKRVLLVLQSTSVGGMETHCFEVAAELTRRGMNVTAVVPEPAIFDDLGHRFARCGAAVRRLDTDGRRGRRTEVIKWLSLVRFCRDWRPDVVHLHTGGATGGLAVVLAGRLAGATTVITEHDVPRESPSWHQRITRRTMDWLAHAIIAVSRRNARLRASRLVTPRHKLVSILNGVGIADVTDGARERNRRDVRSELGLALGDVVLGSLVRLAEGKGLHDLIRAFAIARSASDKLLLVGDGPLRLELEALTRELGVGGDVCFAGHRAEPVRYLDAMDAFVLAVPAGSMSVALLEAMARGLPPVITFCGPEEPVLDGETGLCGPPSDPVRLAAVLTTMLGDGDLRERLGRGAAAHTRRYFSIARVADDLTELYAACPTSVPIRLRADYELDLPWASAHSGPGFQRV